MDKMSVTSILLVSLPEMILIVITALMIAGYKDILNFKDKKNIWRLFIASSLMCLFSTIGRMLFNSITTNLLVMMVLYPLIVYLVYRYNIISTICGVLVALVPLLLGEAIFVSLLLKITNMPISQVYASNLLRIAFSLPIRICQLLAVILISRLKNYNLSMVKLNVDEWIQVVLFVLMISSSLSSIESGFNNLNKDYNTIIKLIINVLIAVLFSSWMIYCIYKIRRKSDIDKRINYFELKRIKKLLEEGYTDHVINLINIKLHEEGKS
ncbi:MAG TPA: hypothetical protein GXX36_01855 [Clostridiaceae bacterium]|nr:hypothetical protein [Clostridiaceae bacterium]